MSEAKSYSFNTDSVGYEVVETKSGKDFFVTGYISTKDVDLYNDLVTEKCMNSMLNQINENTITLDYEHEAFRDDHTILPVGKIVEAKADSKGIWVRAKLNDDSPKFKSLWNSIKNGFVNSFSIAFKAVSTATKTIGNTVVRLLDDVKLLNVALTGVPVNPSAKIDGFGMKAMILKSIQETEEVNMVETKVEEKAQEQVVIQPEVKCNAPEAKAEAEGSKEDKKEDEEEEKKKKEAETKSLEILAELKSLKESNAKLVEELKALKEHSVFKSPIAETKSVDLNLQKAKSPLDLIK